MVVVKKSDILKGVKKIEKVKIEALDGDEMYLRPLSQAEINEVDEIEAKAMGIFETNETAQRGRRQKPKSVVESRGKISRASTEGTAPSQDQSHFLVFGQ